MRLKLSLLLLTSIFASQLYAGSVKNKKAMRASDEKVAKSVEETKTACGNKALKVDMNWDAYNKFIGDEKTAKIITKSGDKTIFIFGYAGERGAATLGGLALLCKDKDYKGEISKVEKIKMIPNPDFMSNKSIFKLTDGGKTIEATPTHRMTRSASDFATELKKLW